MNTNLHISDKSKEKDQDKSVSMSGRGKGKGPAFPGDFIALGSKSSSSKVGVAAPPPSR